MTLLPEISETPLMIQVAAPDAVPDPLVAALDHVTLDTPMLSDALPPKLIVDEAVEYVELLVGEVIVHVGLVVSGKVHVTVIVLNPVFPATS